MVIINCSIIYRLFILPLYWFFGAFFSAFCSIFIIITDIYGCNSTFCFWCPFYNFPLCFGGVFWLWLFHICFFSPFFIFYYLPCLKYQTKFLLSINVELVPLYQNFFRVLEKKTSPSLFKTLINDPANAFRSLKFLKRLFQLKH